MPFTYPDKPHLRRHGPAGYANYASYRPWLRDEFLFRCVYCLKREQWGLVKGHYTLDHFLPQTHFPELALDYENLLYACATCNAAKGDATVPSPCECMLKNEAIVYEDGSIKGTNSDSQRVIRKLGLDDPEYRDFRRLWIDIVAMAVNSERRDLWRRLMQYPDELPDLSPLRPPEGNTRPEGIGQSCHARRQRGELPTTY